MGREGRARQSSVDGYLKRPDGHERIASGEHASVSGAGHSGEATRVTEGISFGQWSLEKDVWVEEPGRSMTSKEIQKFRNDWIIPSTVMLRPLEEGELASRPPPGWVAVHEHMFKHGFTLPLPGWVQYILSALNLAPGQIGTNAWRQLLGMYVLWQLSGQDWPTHNEVFACYKAMYSNKKGCSGTVTLHSRAFGSIVEDLPTSVSNWRSTVCLAGGEWENSGFESPCRVPTTFQPIGVRKPKLTYTERARIERVLKGFSGEWNRSSYRLIRFPVLEHVGVGKVPKVELPKVVRKKMDPLSNAEDDFAIMHELLVVGEKTQTLSVSPITLAVQETDNVVHLEMPEESYLLNHPTDELPFDQILNSSKSSSTVSSHGSLVAAKRVAEDVPLEGQLDKRPRNDNVTARECPRIQLNRVLEEAGMADEGFVRRMVADLKDASVDKLLATSATPRENRDKMLQYMMRGIHALYMIDDVERDPVSREQLVKMEKAFEGAEAARAKAVAVQEKLRGEKVEMSKKLEAQKKNIRSLQVENAKLSDEVAHLMEEITRLKVVEESVKDLTEKIESLPIQIAEAARNGAERGVEEFKKSNEFAALLKEQHRKSVTENIKLYRDRGWLNIEKFKADREADMAAAQAEKERAAKVADATHQGEKGPDAEEQAMEEQGEGSEEARDRSLTSVPKTLGISGSETV